MNIKVWNKKQEKLDDLNNGLAEMLELYHRREFGYGLYYKGGYFDKLIEYNKRKIDYPASFVEMNGNAIKKIDRKNEEIFERIFGCTPSAYKKRRIEVNNAMGKTNTEQLIIDLIMEVDKNAR